jgi:hypothetical protein
VGDKTRTHMTRDKWSFVASARRVRFAIAARQREGHGAVKRDRSDLAVKQWEPFLISLGFHCERSPITSVEVYLVKRDDVAANAEHRSNLAGGRGLFLDFAEYAKRFRCAPVARSGAVHGVDETASTNWGRVFAFERIKIAPSLEAR